MTYPEMAYAVYLSNGPDGDASRPPDPVIIRGLTAEEAVTIANLAMAHGVGDVDVVLRPESLLEDEE